MRNYTRYLLLSTPLIVLGCLFHFWLSGNEFVRGPKLGEVWQTITCACILNTVLSAVLYGMYRDSLYYQYVVKNDEEALFK